MQVLMCHSTETTSLQEKRMLKQFDSSHSLRTDLFTLPPEQHPLSFYMICLIKPFLTLLL